MTTTISPIEFSVTLRTGEVIEVTELDPGRIPSMADVEVMEAAFLVVNRCSRMPRGAIDAAKIGHSAHFEELMRTPPVGGLMKLERPVCAEIETCAAADRLVCTTRNVEKRLRDRMRPGLFPLCWEFEVDKNVPPLVASTARDLAGCVILAWRYGRLVVIVDANIP